MKKRECKTKEVELLEKEIRDLKFSLDIAESALDHLLQSKFIRSFRMMNGNGGFVRPIDEADRIAYGNDTSLSDGGVFELQKKLKESNSDEDLHIIYNHKVIIIRFDRIQTIEYKESLTALFKDQGIVCIILDRCEIDYTC